MLPPSQHLCHYHIHNLHCCHPVHAYNPPIQQHNDSFCLSHSNSLHTIRKCSTSSTHITTASWTWPNFPNACFFTVFTHVPWYHKSSCTVVSQTSQANPSIAIHAGLSLACETKVTAVEANHVSQDILYPPEILYPHCTVSDIVLFLVLLLLLSMMSCLCKYCTHAQQRFFLLWLVQSGGHCM